MNHSVGIYGQVEFISCSLSLLWSFDVQLEACYPIVFIG